MEAKNIDHVTATNVRPKILLRVLIACVRPEWCFLIIMLLVGSCFAILIPAGAGADEPNHIARAISIAHGNIRADKIENRRGYTSPQDTKGVDSALYGGSVDSSIIDVAMQNMYTFHTKKDENGGQRVYEFPTWKTKGTDSSKIIGRGERNEAFSNAAVNSPLVYLPSIIGYWIARLFTNNAYAIIIVMRLSSLLCSTIIVFFSIKLIPIGKWIMATVSLIPTMFVFNANVTADTMTYAVSTAFLSVVLCCSLHESDLNRIKWILLSVASISLALVKLSYLPMLALLLLIILFNPFVRNKRSLLRLCGIVMSTTIIFFIWYSSISMINTGAMFDVGASPTLQKQFMIQDPLRYLVALGKQFAEQNFFNIGVYGPLDAHGHWLYSGWVTILALCCAVGLKDEREYGVAKVRVHLARFAFVMLFVAGCVFVLVETALYLQFNSVGRNIIDGVQSRYFLPILSLLLLPIFVMHTDRVDSKKENLPEQQASLHISFATLSMLTIQLTSALFSLYVLYTALYHV